jgi:hypothetical protein
MSVEYTYLAPCPACQTPIEVPEGGIAHPPYWYWRCGHCKSPIRADLRPGGWVWYTSPEEADLDPYYVWTSQPCPECERHTFFAPPIPFRHDCHRDVIE